jgi:predicted TIM-barrel fold metal-dependent hydrolase
MPKKMVDVHCHVVGHERMMSEEVINLFAKMLPWNCGLPTPETLLKNLDEAGVAYAVLQAYDMKEVGLDIPNEYVAEVLKQYPDRFICGYASVDPIKRGTPDAVALLKEAYDMGLRGLKLHPIGMQFSPDDRRLYPLYEKCIEYDIPVGFHIQPVPGMPRCRLKFCNIVPIDELAHDLPELKIQICHFGKYPMLPDVLDLAACIMNNKNVYTDTSAPMPMTKEGILNTFLFIKKLNLADKCMFGTDFPVQPQSWWVECLKQVDFTEEEKAKIMGGNALAFVGRTDLLE